jgi:hypothetical protein
MPFFPSRWSLRAFVALGACAVVLAGTVAASAATAPTAASVIKATTTALNAEKGVHVVVHTTAGATKTKVVVDIGTTTGKEVITSGAKSVTITVTPAAVYVKGNKLGLTTIMGLTAAQQKIVGTKSITVKAGSSTYTSFKASLTTPALIAFLPAAKGTTLLPVVAGSGSYQLKWTTAATSSSSASTNVLKISSAKNSLPESEKVTTSNGGGTTVFSKWGETVNPATPSASSQVTYKKVFG